MTYTAVTFAPVQGFIMASRKLRDLYGSSLLISHLACAMTRDAEALNLEIVSPADVKGSRGVPNVLVIKGDYSQQRAEAALLNCWRMVLMKCRCWIEDYFKSECDYSNDDFDWNSSWRACELYSWEMFHGQGATIQEARKVLAITKQQRKWAIPNWTGESSTLSSVEAVVRPKMGARLDPRKLSAATIQQEARGFLQALCTSDDLGEAFAGANEEISLTELVKRLITYRPVARFALATDENRTLSNKELNTILPERFDLLTNRSIDKPESIIWFMADGDGIGSYLESLALQSSEEDALRQFTGPMREWAAKLYQAVPAALPDHATVVYAGGDDLFGALHESLPGRKDLTTDHLWTWLSVYQRLWAEASPSDPDDPDKKPQLTVSMGLVWADTQVPQREALQHAREAEATAKARGKDRFALRLLYANGNHLEWTCPWAWLEPIRSHYTDREGRRIGASRDGKPPNWRHLAEDLQWLQSRQAIPETGHTLWDAYFPGYTVPTDRHTENLPEKGRRFDQWLWDLGRVMAGLEKYEPSKPNIGVRP